MTTTTTGGAGFGRWLNAQVDRDDVIGDVARDVREDRRFGCLRAMTARGIRLHITACHDPSTRALEALEQAVREYEAGPPTPASLYQKCQ